MVRKIAYKWKTVKANKLIFMENQDALMTGLGFLSNW